MNEENIYIKQGYKSRQDYLMSLAEEFDISYGIVKVFADTLGEAEDFDGLITYLEDEFG